MGVASFSADHEGRTSAEAQTKATCSVLGLCEARRLVVDVLQLYLDFEQAWVAGGIQGPSPPWPLTPGQSPASVARGFDDESIDGYFLPIQVLVQPELPLHTQAKVSINVSACRKEVRMHGQSYEALKGFVQKDKSDRWLMGRIFLISGFD